MKLKIKMLSLKLKIYIVDGDRKIENFNKTQWDETCIIFQKLIRNLKEEVPEVTVTNYSEENIPYVTMDLAYDDNISEDKMTYAMSYLSGNETDNPVYFDGEEEPCMADSEIIFEDDKEESLLERFNKMAVESENN